MGFLRRRVRAVAVALALCSAVAACSSDDDASGALPARPGPTQRSTPPPTLPPTLPPATSTLPSPSEPSGTTAPTPADGRKLVNGVALKQSDLGDKGTVELRPDGDQVDGQVTLDNCGFAFTTESARIARRQVDVTLTGDQGASFSNEVVAYPNDETAARAMEEMRQSVRGCDGTKPQPSSLGGSYLFAVREFSEHAGGYPVDDAMSMSELVTAEDGTQIYLLAVYLHAGTVLDGHYYASTQKPTPADVSSLTEQARITAARLTAESV